MSIYEFDDLVSQIALESEYSPVPCSASVVAMTLLAVSIAVGLAFFFLGFVFLFFCIGLLVWACGSVALILISGPGTVAGLIGAIHDRHSASGLIVGLLGCFLNAAITVAGVCYLVAFMGYWR